MRAGLTFLELSRLPREARDTFLGSLTGDELQTLKRCWPFWARPEQLWEAGPETYTVACAGRGWGKNRWAVETTLGWAADEAQTGGYMLFVGATNNDVQSTMLYGESGFVTLGSITPGLRVRHYKGRLEVIKVSAQSSTGRWRETCNIRFASAETPDRMRGPSVGRIWYDELGTFPLHRADDNVWAQRTFVLRKPVAGGIKGIVSMTPKPTDEIRELFAECYEPRCPGCGVRAEKSRAFERRTCACGRTFWPDVRIVGGSIFDNVAHVDPAMLSAVERLKGTRLYEQEARGVLIEDVAGALFHQHTFSMLFSQLRRSDRGDPRDTHEQAVRRELLLTSVIVAVDPSGSVSKTACESGVVVVARQGQVGEITAVVCEDASVRPEDVQAGHTMTATYARAAAEAAWRWGAEAIAIETNYGGDATIEVLNSAVNSVWRERGEGQERPQVIAVWAHASKRQRAGFMSIEQSSTPTRVRYLVLQGEDAQSKWAPLKASLTSFSPLVDTGKRDRMDAVVHGHRVVHDPAAVGTGWIPIAGD